MTTFSSVPLSAGGQALFQVLDKRMSYILLDFLLGTSTLLSKTEAEHSLLMLTSLLIWP